MIRIIKLSILCVCGRSGMYFLVMADLRHKIGSFVVQCDVRHQWIAQRQVGLVSVYCDGVGCYVLCLRHDIPVWQHNGQSTTATSRHCSDMSSDIKAMLNPQQVTQ